MAVMGFITPREAPTPRDVARHYDELDGFYRAAWGEHLHHGLWRDGTETRAEAAASLARRVGARLELAPGARACDIGCGYGATATLLEATAAARVVGLTLSAAQARVAAGRGVAVIVADWLQNPFPDGAFEAAYAIESTEHMGDLARCFAEAFRVLRPGGRLVVCAWLAAPAPAAWQRRLLLEPICREGKLVRLGTAEDYCRLLAAAGFGAVAHEDLTAAVARTWRVALARMALLVATDRRAWRFLLDGAARNRGFALSVPRLLLAYRSGAMRYGIFSARKPAP